MITRNEICVHYLRGKCVAAKCRWQRMKRGEKVCMHDGYIGEEAAK